MVSGKIIYFSGLVSGKVWETKTGKVLGTMKLSSSLSMEETSGDEKKLIDIGSTVTQHANIIPYILAAHGLSGCDTVAQYYGIGKKTVIKKLQSGMALGKIGDIESSFDDVVEEATAFISSCYGFPSENMSICRVKSWFSKTGKARKSAPKLETLPPTTECFKENVKRGHLQIMIWKSTMSQEPPNIDF